jgi:hypothetical protein
MYQLSEQQIDYILNDISARGVEIESLQHNLVDHVCCIIEQNLEENGDFENFYHKTIKTFYKDALWEIEEETLLLLTYKNYYTMKKVMINSGIAAATFFIIGSFFKFMHWPGAAILIMLGMVSGAFIFLPLMFMTKRSETTESREKFLLAIGVVNGIIFCMYSLFKVQHWPYATILWFITLGLFSFVFIPLYFFNGIKNPEKKINTITTTIILIMLAGVFFLQTSLKSSAQFYITKTHNYMQMEELISKAKTIKNDSTNKNNELDLVSTEILNTCNKIKNKIIFDQIGQNSIPVNFENTNQWLEESGLGDEYKNGNNGELIVIELSKLINKYNSLSVKNKKIPNSIEKLLHNNLMQQSNFNLLSSLSQIELYVILSEK